MMCSYTMPTEMSEPWPECQHKLPWPGCQPILETRRQRWAPPPPLMLFTVRPSPRKRREHKFPSHSYIYTFFFLNLYLHLHPYPHPTPYTYTYIFTCTYTYTYTYVYTSGSGSQVVYEKTSGMFFQSSAGSVGYRPTACGYIDHWGSDGLSVRRCSPNQHQVLL
jgi:hypothetical protein